MEHRKNSKLGRLYETLRSDDADCLDLPSVIGLLKDVDKRIGRLVSNQPSRFDPPEPLDGKA